MEVGEEIDLLYCENWFKVKWLGWWVIGVSFPESWRGFINLQNWWRPFVGRARSDADRWKQSINQWSAAAMQKRGSISGRNRKWMLSLFRCIFGDKTVQMFVGVRGGRKRLLSRSLLVENSTINTRRFAFHFLISTTVAAVNLIHFNAV